MPISTTHKFRGGPKFGTFGLEYRSKSGDPCLTWMGGTGGGGGDWG
jgi:hypothetical protein